MTSLPFKRRIHIASVGFEVDRIVLPLEKYLADKVWLLTDKSELKNEGQIFLEQVIEQIENLDHHCSYKVKRHDVENRDLFSAMRSIREIIQEESNHQIFVNVSTGTKIQAIAGMMACMMFKSGESQPTPYYVVPNDYAHHRERGEQMTSGLKDVVCLPDYRIEKPDETLVKTLELIAELSEGSKSVTKKELNNVLLDNGIIQTQRIESTLDQNTKVSAYQKLDRRIINPLQTTWKCISIEGKGRGARISITPDGKNMLTLLGEDQTNI